MRAIFEGPYKLKREIEVQVVIICINLIINNDNNFYISNTVATLLVIQWV